jgi:hypothetical protein
MAAAEEIVFRADRRKSLWAFLLGTMFVFAGSSLVLAGGFATVVGIVNIVFFGTLTAVIGYVLIRPPVVIAIGSGGVRTGQLFAWARRRVPWDAIAEVRIFRLEMAPVGPGVRMLGLVPVDPDAPVWRRGRMAKVTTTFAETPVVISDRSLSIELEEVVEIMRRFSPDLAFGYGRPIVSGFGKLTRPAQWRKR